MKLPYAISDFDSLITRGYHYVDRTDHIPLLEAAGDQLLFLRPRRFGKSLLLSMLENYYDINKADRFDALFGRLAIGQTPTEERNRYLVMKWDFSGVGAAGDMAAITGSLYRYLNLQIETFSAYYRALLTDSPRIEPEDAIASFQSLLAIVQRSGHSLYLLIDEYDNFANELMMGHQNPDEDRYRALLSGEGVMKTLFKTVKMAAGSGGIGRVFITGVSPVAMSDLTSAYNVARNIYLDARFNELCGFREAEIAGMTTAIANDCYLPDERALDAVAMMRTFYNGYRFSRRAKQHVYNPTLALYFLAEFQRECRHPDEILDNNLAMDRGKMHYIASLPFGRDVIVQALTDSESVCVLRIADRFGVEDMLHGPKDTDFVASLLYYFGILTLGGMSPFGELILRIPNLVIRRLYAETLREMMLPEDSALNTARQVARALYQHGEMAPLCAFVEQNYFKVFSNRDYRWSNELTIKTAFLTLLFNDTLYIMESEAEIERAHTDLTMIVRPDMREYQVLDILIEFKFVSLKDAGLDGEEVRTMEDATLRALPSVQAKQREAEEGLARYQARLNGKFGDLPRLRCFTVVAVGFERLVFDDLATRDTPAL
uniref:Predicted AAA-ATPase n=1 Tax=Candidatus Kentrum sp. MB TaxID=2138164 RepID=A0A451BD44_9GAMM|nr:MAG: Predicted AAA-ATPase [Candidatus Kentron sp. MB]VFK35081.1 MAG: Predicted AAA-ATPase [Candidatus Kentron sp. MB]VFK76213.1 MAG: Predicted AAA-ATPase [Candidatus Kentron sp. MB]